MDITNEPQNIISLCTGMRGLERGIERAGIDVRVVCYVEIEAFVCENLVRQMEQGVLAPAPIWTDVKTFPAEEFRGKIHGITGGYPCQPFSVAGQRAGTNDPRHLWPYIKSMVGTIRPVWCFFENVTGHISLGYREVRSDLEQLGYTVEEGIFSSEEVGAPHQRKRLFILAVDMAYTKNSRDYGRKERMVKQDEELQTQKESRKNERSEFVMPSGMGYTKSQFCKQPGIPWTRWTRLTNSSCELANANDNGERARSNNTEGESKETEGEKQWQERNEIFGERMRSESSVTGELGNTDNSRLQGRNSEECGECTYKWIAWPNDSFGQWPSRPGEEQYSWEEPRIESRVGFTVNGYNFREDLLRMAGNGVVSQCAAKATFELWNKILN